MRSPASSVSAVLQPAPAIRTKRRGCLVTETELAALYAGQRYTDFDQNGVAMIMSLPPPEPIPEFEHRFARLAERSFIYEMQPYIVAPTHARGRRPTAPHHRRSIGAA